MNFRKIKDRVFHELNLTYRDLLRVIFSKKFVRNRRFYTAIAIAPPLYWAVAIEDKEFQDIKGQRDRIKYIDIEDRIDEELPQTKKMWRYLVNYDVKNFPR